MGSSASSSASGSESEEENSDYETQVCESKPVQVALPVESDNLGDIDLNQLFDHVTLREAASKIRDDVPETVVQQHHGHLVRWLEERYQRSEETISLTQFCDVLMNRGISREECTIAFDQFDVDGEGQAYVESMLDALRSSNGANLRGELSHAIRILTACTLTPGLIDVFSSDRESVGQHGQRILKYLLRNRAPSSALPYPSLDGFSHTTTMRLSVLDQHLQEKQRQSAFRDSFELEGGGEVKLTTKCFKSIQVSTNPREASRLTDGDPSTYWQSDGPAHTHWVRFKLRPGVCLKHLSIQVARGDHSYMPQHVTVLTGHSPVSLQEVTEVRIPSHITGDVSLLENAKVIRPYVQISIKRCQFEGCDVRVHGIRALGYKMVQKSEVSVKDASAMWYLSVLASTANAAIPIAPHLRSAILNHTKMALSHMPPLSLMPQQLSKASFLSPHVLDQVAEFLHNIARNERGELEMEGLKILLEFALARGNLASILKALQDLLDHKNNEIEGAVKMLRNLNAVRDSILKKHGTQLTMTLEGCDGGQQDESTAPSNVLCGNWSAKGYVSNTPKVNMFFTRDTPFQVTKVQIKVAKGATGPKCGLIFVYNDQKGFDLKRHQAIFEKYDSWNSSDYKIFQGLRAASICGKPDNPVAYFSLDNDWDEVEVPLDQCFVGQYALIKFLGPRSDTATRLGIVGVQFYGFSRTSSVLDNIDISNVAPLPYDVDAPINTMVLFTQVMSFIVRICQDLEVMKKRKEGTLTRIPVPDMQHLTLNIISQLYNAIPQDDNRWVYARILCLNLLHISIPNLAKLREKETAKARMLSNLQLQDHPKLGELQLHGSQTQETQSETQPATDTQTSQGTPTQEMLANVPSQGEPSRGEQRGDTAEGEQTAPVQESQNTQHQGSDSGQTLETKPTSSTPPPMAIPGTSSPMLDSKELDTSLDQRQARELFNHLCQLASFDGGDGSQDDPRILLKAAAEGCILDGAAVFFPGKEARREELFNMMNSMVTGEDTAVGLVFQSLCRFFSTVDPSGLLELPSSSQEEFNQGSVLMVFDTLLSASYKEFVELIEDGEEASPPSAPSHVCSLLCALQTSLLGWAKHCLTDSKGDSKLKKTAGDVIRDYCGMQCSWTRNALCLLQGQKGINNRFNDLIHTFIPTAFRQMVLCVTLLSEMDLPYLHLAQRLLSVAVEIRQLETKLNIHFPKDGSPVQCSAKEDVVILRKWHIESAHNYDNNQHVTQIFTCPGADLFEVTFDTKCETERRYDYLEFTDSKGVKTRYDQKVGSDKWPTSVTFNSGQRLQFLFHSDSSNNFWGYSFDVIAKGKPDVSLPWLYDLQLGLAKLIGTLCSQILSLKSERQMREEIWESDEQKRKAREALSSQNFFQTLFRGGHNVGKPLRSLSGENSLVTMGSRVHKFLVQVAEGTNRPTPDTSIATNNKDHPCSDPETDAEDILVSKAVDTFLEECHEKGQTPNMGGPVITGTVHAVFAALLWHSGSLREYIEKYVNEDTSVPITDDILYAFRTAEGLRPFLANLRQTYVYSEEKKAPNKTLKDNFNPDEPVNVCRAKASFLLEFPPVVKQERKKINKSLPLRSLSNASTTADFEGFQGPAEEETILRYYPEFKLVLDFVKNPHLDHMRVRSILRVREQSAKAVSEVYKLASQFLSAHNKPHIFQSQCVLFLKDMLLQRQLGAPPPIHYASRLEGCGLELEDRVRAAYYNFVKQLVEAEPSEYQSSQSDDVKAASSCIQNMLLHLMDVSWSPSDWQFVANIKAPSLLISAARTSGNMTLRDSTAGDNLSYAQQLKAYKQCEDWMKECEGDDSFNTWFSNISRFPDKEERRARHMFVARFCDRLDIQVACDGCNVQLLGQRYRCLVCEDFDFCYNCCQGGAKPDEHADDHPLVHLMYKCDGCHGLIVGTRYHCNVCEDFDLCYGCQHTGHYPSSHNEFHDSTEIMMRVLYTGSQYSAQLNNYTHLHSWLQFTFLTLSLAQAIYDQQTQGTLTSAQETVGKELLKSCVELAMEGLEVTCSSDDESGGTMSIHERVFAEQSQERMLGLLAAMLPADKGSNKSFSTAMALFSVDKFLPLLFTIAQKGSGHYVPTQHLAMGLLGQLLPSILPEVSDLALESVTPLSTPEPPDSWEDRLEEPSKEAQSDGKKEEKDKEEISTKDEKDRENTSTKEDGKKEGEKDDGGTVGEKVVEEKKSIGEKGKRAGNQEVQKSKKIKLTRDDSIASSDMDGTRTIKFLFSFGASCLEKSRLEWAALLPTMLQKLCRHLGWKASITRQISHSIERLPEDSSLRSVFALFVVAGFPEVLGHGSTASYLDGNRELTDVLILKHFFEKGRVCVVDVKTRKMKHVPEYQLQLSGSGGQVLDGERFLAFTDIARIIMLQLKDGTCAQLSVENLWVLYLVLKAMLASLKVNYSQLLNSDLLPLLVHLAGQPTKLSKRWLLKDLEILSIKLYTRGKAKTSGITQLPSVPLGMGTVVGPEHKEPLPAKLPRSRNSFSSESSGSSDLGGNDDLLNLDSDISTESDDSESWHSYLTADSLPQSLPLEEYGIDVDEEGEEGVEDQGEGNNPDPMGGLDDKAKACLQATHEAILAPVSILRAMFEKCNKNIQDLVEEVQKCFQGEELIVSDEIKQLAKRWEPKPPPEAREPTEFKTIDTGALTYTPVPSIPREQDDNYAVPELSQHAPILVANSEAELRESYRKHQRTKSGELLKKELEKHGKSASRNYLHVINNALAVMCARQVLAALLADWPATGDHVISTNTFGCKEHSQLVSILDLLQRVEEKDVFLKVVENVVHHCEDGLLAPLCLAACSFMQVTVMLPKTLESKHNYETNVTEQGSITLPGATHLSIKFDERCCTESCCDTLQISSNSSFKHDVHTFSGHYGSANWVDFDLPGDTLYYKFHSDDGSSTEWGYKLTVTGNKLGRFETGYVILNTVLANPKLAQQVPLQELWEWLVQVARKQVGQSRLKAVQLLLRILASIPSPCDDPSDPSASSTPPVADPPTPADQDTIGEDPPPSSTPAPTPSPARPPVDLTRLKPLWLLLDSMNCRLSADCAPQSLAAAHRALMELFLMVENMVQEWDMVEEYVLAMSNDDAIKKAIVQGATNIKCIQLALDKSSSAEVEEPATRTDTTTANGENVNNNNRTARLEIEDVPLMNPVLFSQLFR
ncbi:zinc finger ZZ-type and EF-hand domain-containing protein 1-like isoform X3 [Lytechinus variegatus]|uniref:zinc finger ZZ-type and EF-hand domain-containing protein 1-like isoform X3 n=1 Tax=Lytechinus variegatus TaxID=7654 RepID=UPI001BB2006A|nr:zinc finger ZZ-type and EF-hand domain-containing protein 1-like isoform X3 [Lytechinus variegatus]